MSNGHYTALVVSHQVMHAALEYAVRHVFTPDDVRQRAQEALDQVDEISNCNGITQPNNEQDACPGCGGSKSERRVIHNDPLTHVVCKHPWHTGNWHEPDFYKENNNVR